MVDEALHTQGQKKSIVTFHIIARCAVRLLRAGRRAQCFPRDPSHSLWRKLGASRGFQFSDETSETQDEVVSTLGQTGAVLHISAPSMQVAGFAAHDEGLRCL